MASTFKVDIKGTETILKRFKEKPAQVEKDVQAMLDTFGLNTVASAKQNLAEGITDRGKLANSISFKRDKSEKGKPKVEIIVASNYAAYVEFGTRARTDIPAGWTEFAAKFKGKSGSGDYFDFLNAILDWVIRKGIASRFSTKTKKKINIKLGSGSDDEKRLHDTAEAIAFSIIRHGSKPHPYFIPAIEANRQKLIDDIKNYQS